MGTSITKQVAKNFSWLLFGNIISSLFNVFVIIYIARVLGAASFGTLKFAQAFLAYLIIIIDSGLSLLGTKEIAKESSNAASISINIFIIRFIIALAEFAVSFVFIYFLPIAFDLKLLFMAVFLLVFSRAINTDWVFQGLGKMEYIAFSRIAFSFLSFCAILTAVKTPANLISIPLIQFLFGTITSLLFIYILYDRFIGFKIGLFSKKILWNYIAQAVPLGASIFLVQIYNNLDTIMLGFMDKAAAVGYYNAAYQVFNLLVGGYVIWQATAIPIVSKIINEDVDRAAVFLRKYLKITMLCIIPATVLIFLTSPIIIQLAFGNEYNSAVLALQSLIWTLIVISIGSIYGVLILVPAGKYNQFLIAVAVGALVNIILNFILIPQYSFVGAAIATIVAEAAAATIAFYFSRKVLKLGLLNSLKSPIFLSCLSLLAYFCSFNAMFLLPNIVRISFSSLVFSFSFIILAAIFEKEFILGFIGEVFRRS